MNTTPIQLDEVVADQGERASPAVLETGTRAADPERPASRLRS
jgi:hypothetical protein